MSTLQMIAYTFSFACAGVGLLGFVAAATIVKDEWF